VAALAPDWQRYVARQTDRIVNQLRNKRRGRAPGADSGGGGKKRSAQRLLSEATLREIPAFITSEMAKVSNAELVLVNGDLTEDHVLLARTGHAWTISGIIDFADARLAPRAYEWPALWFSALDRNDLALHTLMASYDPDLILDGDFFRRAMAFTFLHEFGALIIEAILEDLDAPQVTSLAHLQALLWGPK
jgi:hygromycin-B 7''-O-kinase